MDFHHLIKDEKEHKLSDLITDSRIVEFFDEIKKCVLLCSNCHRELHWLEDNNPTFDQYAYINSIVEFEDCITRDYTRLERTCMSCGEIIGNGGETNLCIKCFGKTKRVVARPSAIELVELIKNSNVNAVGRHYGVSGNAIKKWLLSYNLPSSKKELDKL